MKKISILFIIFLLISSCTQKDFISLSEYSNTTVKFAKRQLIDKRLDFKIFIPIGYDIKIKENLTDNVILSFEAKPKTTGDNNQSMISIQKVKGFKDNTNLQSEFNNSVDEILDFNEVKILESGPSKLLNYDSYFVHIAPDNNDPEKNDFVMFVLESKEDNIFYNISAISPLTKDLKTKMAMLINCIRTFEKIV